MKLKASFCVVLMMFAVSSGYAEKSRNQPREHTGLSLFMTAEEQLVLEQIHAAAPMQTVDQMSLDLKQNPSNNQPDGPFIEADDVAAVLEERLAKPVRFDGVLLKNDLMLGVWINGIQVSNLDNFTDTNLSVNASKGQLNVVAGKRTVTLLPGDSFPAFNSGDGGWLSSDEVQSPDSHLTDSNLKSIVVNSGALATDFAGSN